MGDSTTKPGSGWTTTTPTPGRARSPATPAPTPAPAAAQPPAPGSGWGAAVPTRPRRDSGQLGLASQQAARGALPLDQVDQLPPKQRRWSMDVQAALGLKSLLGQNQILASSIATATRIAETRPKAAGLAAKHPGVTGADPFASVVDQLAEYEQLKQPDRADRSVLRSAIEIAQEQSLSPEQDKDCADLLNSLRAEELREEITSLGMPPWDGTKGMAGAAAKVELDLLSIPSDRRTVVPFSGSVNATFWVNRTDGTGNESKSFLCKTPSKEPLDGIPAGGEVAREGLTARAASSLAGKLGISVAMPETHAITLDQGFLPANKRDGTGKPVTCSIQEVRTHNGDMRAQSRTDRAAFNSEECAALAVLDLVTLNTDRHVGNLLAGTDGSLVPIDHGACMPEGVEDSVTRIAESIGAPRNVLLSLPGTHKPMPEALRKSLMALDPSALAAELTHERDTIEANTPAMKGKVSDHSIAMSARAAEFLKIAAGVEADGRTLSPAAIQIAFGAHAKELLAAVGEKHAEDEDGNDTASVDGFKLSHQDFVRRSQEIAQQALKDQPLMEVMSLMTDNEKRAIALKLQKKGWSCAGPISAPANSVMNNPVAAIKIIASGQDLQDRDQAQVMESLKTTQFLPNDKLMLKLAEMRLQVADELAGFLPEAKATKLRAFFKSNEARLKVDPDALGRLSDTLEADVIAHMTAEVKQLDRDFVLKPEDVKYLDSCLEDRDFAFLDRRYKRLRQDGEDGTLPRRAAAQGTGTHG